MDQGVRSTLLKKKNLRPRTLIPSLAKTHTSSVIVLPTFQCSMCGPEIFATKPRECTSPRLSKSQSPLLIYTRHRFSEKGLRWELPFYPGTLVAIIHLTDSKSSRDHDLKKRVGCITDWGKPRLPWISFHEEMRPKPPCEDCNREFWKARVPVIQF